MYKKTIFLIPLGTILTVFLTTKGEIRLKFNQLIEGIFIEESKNRFLCKVLINNEVCECYVPSSSRIENYLNMKGKKVLLTPNIKSNSRTKYSLFAVKFYNKYILLNLNLTNKVVESVIRKRKKEFNNYQILREKTYHGYKTDLLLTNQNETLIIEVKGIISSRNEVSFPSVHSERAIKQLKKIENLLKSGISVTYVIASLSPIVKKIVLNQNFNEYQRHLIECIELGMELKAISLKFEDNEIQYNKRLKIIF